MSSRTPSDSRHHLRTVLGAGMATAAILATSTLSTAGAVAPTASQYRADLPIAFQRMATYPVYLNAPAGADPADETVAEISDVSEDGRTLIYSDAAGKRIGFLDISRPTTPRGLGSLDLEQIGDADDQPTSVAVLGGFVLVVIDESGGDFVNPSGRLDVVRLSDRTVVRSIDLGGQPDSIAISKDKQYAAIAMENQRDEDFTPVGLDEGDLPQLPAGFVQTIDLSGPVAGWSATPIALTEDNGDALPAFLDAGIDAPTDPEPEYVSINENNELALSLQENNGVVIIDLPTRTIRNVFSAGTATVTGIDSQDDGFFDQTGSIVDKPREPDALAWVGDGLVATANEGDWKGGTRGWTVFDAASGDVVWDAGNSLERLAMRVGLHNEDRAGKKGVEIEGLAFAHYRGKPYAFVGSERSNFVAVYDMTNPRQPRFEQVLPTTNGPEGILPIPGRNLLALSSEVDDADALVRSSVSLYRLGLGKSQFPQVRSADDAGSPIGWGALSALSAAPNDRRHLWTASDSAYATGRIYRMDVSKKPAILDRVLTVHDEQGPLDPIDIEGLFARPGGGFWVASEGSTGAENRLIKTDATGKVLRSVSLPTGISEHVGKWGLEGVTAQGRGKSERVYVVLQRPLFQDPSNLAAGTVDGDNITRIGRYNVKNGRWSWFGYRTGSTSAPGDWIGVSEVSVIGRNRLAIIERDKLNGPDARIKRVYTVRVPLFAGRQDLRVLPKRLLVDALPALRTTHGWTQEKLEGFTRGADGRFYAVTDNDGVDDASGETVFLRLGRFPSWPWLRR